MTTEPETKTDEAPAPAATRYQKPEKSLADLRAEAAELGIETDGLGRQALAATIAAVRQAVANLPATGDGLIGESVIGEDVIGDPEIRTDETGEELGPENLRRVPMGVRARRLDADERPGFYRRWINNAPGRIERAMRAGYAHVKDRSGKPLSTPCGVQEQGGGMRAYLMEQPQHFREQDLAAKSAVNDDIDRAVNRGSFQEEADDKRYVPDAGIKVNMRARRAR